MSLNRPFRKLFVLVVVAVALVVAIQIAGHSVAAASGQSESSVANKQGDPNAVPPILAPATASELAAMRQAEAWEAQKFYYDPPASAPYSLAEMAAYGSSGK